MKNGEDSLSGWLTELYIYAMLLFYPLFTGFWGYTRITASKLGFLLIITVLWLLGLVAASVKERGSKLSRPSAVSLCLLAYLLICCLSAALSPNRGSVLLGAGRFDGLFSILISLCVFFGVSRWARPRLGYVYALTVSMCLCCAVAVFQLLGFDALGLFPGDYTYYDKGVKFTGEFLGTIGNANLFSAFLCLCLPLISGVFITLKKARYFLLPALALGAFCTFECTVSAGKLALFLCVLIGAPLLVTDARRLSRAALAAAVFLAAFALSSGFSGERSQDGVTLYFTFGTRELLGFIGAALLTAAFFAFKNARFKRQNLRVFLAVLSLGIAAAALVFVYNIGRGEGTLYEISRVLHGDVRDGFGSSRIMIWRDCLELFAESPILGGGPGTTALRLDIGFSRLVEETGKTLTADVDNAHNVYLGILTDTGIVGLLPYLAAIVFTLVKAARGALSRPTVFSIGLCLLCYWVQDFFGLGLFIVSPVMWILWGLCVSGLRTASQPQLRQ